MTDNKSIHYVDNEKFYQACLTYKENCTVALAEGKPKPKIPEYIGECLLKIATKISYSRSFINYPFRDDMIGDAIENCLMYFDNFDPYKYKNPFSYFTQIVYFAFLRRIEKEKKALYVKHKVREQKIIENDFAEFNDIDNDLTVVIQEETANMREFVEKYEDRMQKRKNTKKKVANGKTDD